MRKRTIKKQHREGGVIATEPDRVLFQADVARRYGVDRVTIFRWEQSGRLPPADVKIGRRRGRYLSKLREWEQSTTAGQ